MKLKFDKYASLSKEAKVRLKWFDYLKECQNVSKTCRHFGIPRKTFYKWRNVYDPNNLFSLEDRSRSPRKTREPEITASQEKRIEELRKKYTRYSKIKIAKIYENI
jgi:transposase-like protein